jgi:hypothetical protein
MAIEEQQRADWLSIERQYGSGFAAASGEAFVVRILAVSGWDTYSECAGPENRELEGKRRRVWEEACEFCCCSSGGQGL